MRRIFYRTGFLFQKLVKRDRFTLLLWLVGMVAFTASGVGKLEVAAQPTTAVVLYAMFVKNPAMVALFGPTPIKNPSAYTLGPIFGQTMSLITGLVFASLAILYVLNRTRRDEEEGRIELFRSYPIGRLANTSAVVVVVWILHVLIAFLITVSLQGQGVAGLDQWSSNSLFALSTSTQGVLWGMVALLIGQLFQESRSAKNLSFTLLGIFYLLRLFTDGHQQELGWFNPLSWSYLGFPYVSNKESGLGVALSLLFALLLLGAALFLEGRRDNGAGYFKGKSVTFFKGPRRLFTLLLYLEGKVITGWWLGLFILGLIYGSMFEQMGAFIAHNKLVKQLFVGNAQTAVVGNFMVTLFSILSVLITMLAVSLLLRLLSEERKGHLDLIYAFPYSKVKVYGSYVCLAIIAGVIAQGITLVGVYFAQVGMENALGFGEIMQAGMIWSVGSVFVLALLALLIAFVPRWASLIWAYVGFILLMTYLGRLVAFPRLLTQLSIYSYIPKLPVEQMNWRVVVLIVVLTVCLLVLGAIGYRHRDLLKE